MYTPENHAGWNDERVLSLKRLWLDGLSASQIAKQLGGVSRNAVIGKVHRLGLSGRANPSLPSLPKKNAAPRVTRPRKVSAANTLRAPTAHVLESRQTSPGVFEAFSPLDTGSKNQVATSSGSVVRFEETGSATILTLGKFMCKWPIGDPSSDEFSLCGRRTHNPKIPYCCDHAELAYKPSTISSRKSDNRQFTRMLSLR